MPRDIACLGPHQGDRTVIVHRLFAYLAHFDLRLRGKYHNRPVETWPGVISKLKIARCGSSWGFTRGRMSQFGGWALFTDQQAGNRYPESLIQYRMYKVLRL